MKKRLLGNIEVSEIGIGCMGFSHGYGEIPEEEYSIEAIRKAYEVGCTFFDTAEAYGSQLYYPGHNEVLLGKAVKEFRDEVVLATKFRFAGYIPSSEEDMEKFIREHLQQSLENLQTDWVDLYYLHRVNDNVSLESIAKIMGKLIKEGKIRGWGLSQVDVDSIKKAHEITPLSAVQNIYSLVERGIEEEVIPFCLENNIGIVPFSPIASGFLSGNVTTETDFSHEDDVRKYVPQLKRENIKANRPILELLDIFSKDKDATKAQIALAWMLHKYPNVVPIPGSKNQERILENLNACKVNLSKDEFEKMENALGAVNIHGYRGFVEKEGSSMREWDRTNKS